MHNNDLYVFAQKYLGKEKVKSTEELLTHELDEVEVILFGFGRIGSKLARNFNVQGVSHVLIDHNPELIDMLEERPGEYIFADASSVEVYRHLFHPSLKMVISTIRDLEDDLLIIQEVQAFNPEVIIVVVSNYAHHAMELYEAGADYVIMPDALGAKHTTALVEEVGFDVEKFIEYKLNHVGELERA